MESAATTAKLRDVTLVFLVRRVAGKITEVCLAMKKRGFGQGRWNGVGGKVESVRGETVLEAAKREAHEEIGVMIGQLKKIALLEFHFTHQPAWDQLVHTFFCEDWQGEPTESEEMRPQWFAVDQIPYAQMWPDDQYWLPQAIGSKLLQAKITFGEGDKVLDLAVTEVAQLQ